MTVALSKPQSNNDWLSWTELKKEYKDSSSKIKNIIKSEKEMDSQDMATLEIASSMKNDLDTTIKEIEKRCLYEYQTMSIEDIKNCNLTDKQQKIAKLRQHKKFTEIGQLLGIETCTVFTIYKQALRKIEGYLKLKDKDKDLNLLSSQQKTILEMKDKGSTDMEIVKKLEISINSLKTQKRRIKQKLGVTKL